MSTGNLVAYPCGLELCFGNLDCENCKYNKGDILNEKPKRKTFADIIRENEVPELTSYPEDPVNHPSHYTYGDVETIDQMVAMFGPEFVAIHCRITVFKYLSRYKHKGNPKRDLEKARWYAAKAFNLSFPFEHYTDIPHVSENKYPELNYTEWYVEVAKLDLVRMRCDDKKTYSALLIMDIDKALECLVGEDYKSEA